MFFRFTVLSTLMLCLSTLDLKWKLYFKQLLWRLKTKTRWSLFLYTLHRRPGTHLVGNRFSATVWTFFFKGGRNAAASSKNWCNTTYTPLLAQWRQSSYNAQREAAPGTSTSLPQHWENEGALGSTQVLQWHLILRALLGNRSLYPSLHKNLWFLQRKGRRGAMQHLSIEDESQAECRSLRRKHTVSKQKLGPSCPPVQKFKGEGLGMTQSPTSELTAP